MATHKRNLRFLVFTCLLCTSIHLWAEEPVLGKSHAFQSNENWSWKVTEKPTGTLQLYIESPSRRSTIYDISECMFCAGDEDNCNHDGVFDISSISQPSLATISVVCHVGAHSQKLMIFQPSVNTREPVKIITGAYYVTHSMINNRLLITYDRYVENGRFEEMTEYWPPLSNP